MYSPRLFGETILIGMNNQTKKLQKKNSDLNKKLQRLTITAATQKKQKQKQASQLVAKINPHVQTFKSTISRGIRSAYEAAKARYAYMLKDFLDPRARGAMYELGVNMVPYQRHFTIYVQGANIGTNILSFFPNPVFAGYLANLVLASWNGVKPVAISSTLQTLMDSASGTSATGMSNICDSYNVVGGGVRVSSMRASSLSAVNVSALPFAICGQGYPNSLLTSITSMDNTTATEFGTSLLGSDLSLCSFNSAEEVAQFTTMDVMELSQNFHFTANNEGQSQQILRSTGVSTYHDSANAARTLVGYVNVRDSDGLVFKSDSDASNGSTNSLGWNAINIRFDGPVLTGDFIKCEFMLHLQGAVDLETNGSGSFPPQPVSMKHGFGAKEAWSMAQTAAKFVGDYGPSIIRTGAMMAARSNLPRAVSRLMIQNNNY